MYKIYALMRFISRKTIIKDSSVFQGPAIFANNLLSSVRYKKLAKSDTLFFKFIPLILSSSSSSLGTHALNVQFYATNSTKHTHTFSLAKSFVLFNKALMFLEYVIKNKAPFLIFSTKLLYKFSMCFYNYGSYKLNHFKQYNIMKYFSNRSALLMFPQKAITALEILNINILLVLDVNYYLRLLSYFSKKDFFSVGLVDASVNSHFISLPFVLNRVGLMQQILALRLTFYIKSRSAKISFNELKMLTSRII